MTYSEWQKKYGSKAKQPKATESVAKKAEEWHEKYKPPRTTTTQAAKPGVVSATNLNKQEQLARAADRLAPITSIAKADAGGLMKNSGKVAYRNDGGTRETRLAEANAKNAAAKKAAEDAEKERDRYRRTFDINAARERVKELQKARDTAPTTYVLQEINDKISKINADIYKAEKVAEADGYNALPSNADFNEKSGYIPSVVVGSNREKSAVEKTVGRLWGYESESRYRQGSRDVHAVSEALNTGSVEDKDAILHDYINGAKYAIEGVHYHDAQVAAHPEALNETYRKYRMMTKNEVDRYNYLHNTEGGESAKRYLSALENTLNSRLGQTAAAGLNDAQKVALGLKAGVDSFNTGIKQMFTEDVKPTTATQYAGQTARENLGKSGQFAYDFAQLVGNMAPSILLSTAMTAVGGVAGIGALASAAPVVGSASMGMSAYGNAYADMMQRTGNKEKSKAYAALVGASESTLSYLLSGVSALGGKAVSASRVAKAISAIDNIYIRTAAEFAKAGISEGVEETLQEYLEPLFYSAVFGGDYEAPEFKDAARIFLLAALSGVMFEGGNIVSSAAANVSAANDTYKGMFPDGKSLTPLIDSAIEMNDKKLTKMATDIRAKVEAGEDVSGAEIRKLAERGAKVTNARGKAAIRSQTSADAATAIDFLVRKHEASKTKKTGLETAAQEMERKTEGVRRADAKRILENPTARDALKEYGYKADAEDQVASVRGAIKAMAEAGVDGKTAVAAVLKQDAKEAPTDSVTAEENTPVPTADTTAENVPAEGKFEGNTEVMENGEGNLHLRYGSERNDGADSSVPVRSMEESTRRDSGGEEIRSRPRDEEAASLTYSEEVESKDIIPGGLNNKIRVLKEGDTESTRKAKEYAAERGLELVLFAGDNLHVDKDGRDVSARGAIRDGKVYVRADHPEFTADQIVRHEIGHDMIRNGEVDPDAVRERLRDILTPEQEDILVGMYLEAYTETGKTADEVWEEIICDSLGDLNIFNGEPLEQAAGILLENTRIATEENIEERRTRGPPAESAETQFSEEKKISAKKEKTDVITIGMSDSERAEILSKKVVKAPVYLGEADDLIERERSTKSEERAIAKDALLRIAEEFGAFGKLDVDDIDVQVTLSKKNLRESSYKGANEEQIAKLLPVLRESVKSAIGIEAHDNRYFYDGTTASFSELLGAYVDGNNIIPIRYGLKHINDGQNVLYIVVDQPGFAIPKQKNKTGVVEAHPIQNGVVRTTRPVYEISIPQISKNVNTKDILRYLPDDFLSENQRAIKWEGIAETIQYTNNKNDERYAKYIRSQNKPALEDMVNTAAKAAEYDYDAYHGTNQGDFRKFDWEKTQRADGGFYGRGHYFTKSKSIAEQYGNRIVKVKLKLGKTFVWSDEVNSYKGKRPPEILSRNIVSRINMAKIFPDIFANKVMSYWEYDPAKDDNVQKNIKWSDLENIVNKLSEGLTLTSYADGTYRWHTEGKFWDVPVGESYASKAEAETGKFFAAINALKEKYDGLLSSLTFDDQTTYTQEYGSEITDALKAMGYQSAMDTPEGGEIVVFDSNRIKSADAITYDENDNVIPISERFNDETDDMYFSEELSLRERKEHNRLAVEHFGKTNKWDETGYILLDGTRLDFSGRHDGAPGGYRTVDHRDIRDALGEDYGGDDYSGGMVQFMSEGNIRVMPESDGLNLSVMPTKEQERAIDMFVTRKRGEIILDLDDTNGNTLSSVEYPRGTSASRVIADIHRFFEEGSAPRVSSVAMFHDADFSEELTTLSDLRKDNERLRKQLTHWRNEVKTTDKPTVRRDDVEKLSRRLVRDYHLTVSAEEVTNIVEPLANLLAKNEDVTWNQVRKIVEPAARQMIESAEVLNDESWNEYRDLREFIKKQKIVMSPAEASSIADFNAWKKLNGKIFGGIALGESNVDSIYDELSSKWGEFFNAESEKTDSDRMLRIVEVMNRLTPIYENPYDFNISAATEYLADDIMDSMISPDIRRVKTYADRANARLKAAKQKRIDDLRKKTQSANARAMRDRIIRHSSKLYQDLGTIRKDRNIPEELRAPVAAVLDAINFESKHTVVEDENGRRHVAPKGVEGEPTKRTEKFKDLKAVYRELAKKGQLVIDPNIFNMKGDDGTLAEVIEMGDKRLDEMNVTELQKVWDVIRSMEQTITNWNKAFRAEKAESISEQAHELERDNAQKKRKSELSVGGKVFKLLETDILTPEAYFHRLGKRGDAIFRMLRNAQDDSIRVISETVKFTVGYEDGKTKVKGVVSDEDVRKLKRVVYSVRLGGKDIKMTAAQLMELYALTSREQGLMHILTGGIRLEAQDIGKIKKLDYEDVISGITMDELNNAFKKLTEEQKKIIIALQKYASTKLSEYGNKATMEVYGVKKFTEENYWPIRTDSNDIVQEQATAENEVTSVSNFGMSKATKPDAKTSVVIGNAFDTFANHTVQMATYYGYLAALEDLNRIRNFSFGIGNGSVGDILNRVVGRGKQGSKYLQTLMNDISAGVNKGDVDITIWNNFVGNYKAASVAANLRVVMQQPTAGLRAMSMINPKYFVGIDNPAKGFKTAMKYAPIAQWKDWGYFETHTGRQIENVLFNTDSSLDKAKSAGMWAAGKADSITWGMIWNACVRETRENNPKLNGDPLYKKTAERFNDIINRTQVVDGVLQRPQVMRASGLHTKLATSFMAEPLKTLNMFLSSLYDVRTARNSAEKKTASTQAIRTGLALAITGVVNAAVGTSIADMLRDDDDEQTYWEKYVEALTGFTGDEKTFIDYAKALAKGNLSDQFNPLGMLPYVKDVWSGIQGFAGKDIDDAVWNDIITAAYNLPKAFADTSKKSLFTASLDFAGTVAAAFGLPLKNVKRDVLAFANLIVDGTGNSLMKYRYAKLMMNPSENKEAFLAMMYDAYKNDKDAYEIIRKDLLREGFTEEDLDGGIKSGIKTAFDLSGYVEDKAKKNNYLYSELEQLGGGKASNVMPDDMSPVITYKDDKDKEITVQLDEKEYAKFQKDVGDKAFEILKNTVGGAKWKSMTDDEKKSAISYAYQIARAYGKQNASGYEADDKWLVKALEKAEHADEIVTYKAMRMSYDKNKDGKLNATERNAAINAIAKTEEEKRLLRMLS